MSIGLCINDYYYYLSDFFITGYSIILFNLSIHSVITVLGAATFILWNPSPVVPNISPLSSHSFAT